MMTNAERVAKWRARWKGVACLQCGEQPLAVSEKTGRVTTMCRNHLDAQAARQAKRRGRAKTIAIDEHW